MSNTIGAREASKNFGAILERVLRGEELVITRYDRPIARIIPTAEVMAAPAPAESEVEAEEKPEPLPVKSDTNTAQRERDKILAGVASKRR